jgi:hypothetical protein
VSKGKSVPPRVGEGMVTRTLVVRAKDVVFLKGIVEAHDGVAQVFGERGGSLVLAAPVSRAAELDELVADLCSEFDALKGEATGRSEDQKEEGEGNQPNIF